MHSPAGRGGLAARRTAEAEDRLRLALEIFQRIGAAEAADLAAEIDALTGEAARKDKSSAGAASMTCWPRSPRSRQMPSASSRAWAAPG